MAQSGDKYKTTGSNPQKSTGAEKRKQSRGYREIRVWKVEELEEETEKAEEQRASSQSRF